MMEEVLQSASFLANLPWNNIIIYALIGVGVGFLVGTGAALFAGVTLFKSVLIGSIVGVFGGILGGILGLLSSGKSIIQPPQTEYTISIYFSRGTPYTIPYECNIHNAKTITIRKGKNSSEDHSSTVKTIHASNGREFEIAFNRYLAEELKPLGNGLRLIKIYEVPFPGETPLDMMYNACKEHFPDVEMQTTQEEFHGNN